MRNQMFGAVGTLAIMCGACGASAEGPEETLVNAALASAPSTFFALRDVMWHNPGSGQVAFWQMNGTNIHNSAVNTTGAGAPWALVATGDFNDDGTTDFAWQNKSTDDIAIWMFDSTDVSQQAFEGRVIGKPVGWDLVAAGDLDRNGTDDLAFRNRVSGENAVWKMDGFAATGEFLTPVPDLNWELRGIGDFKGDGSTELMWRRKDNGENAVWVMNPNARTSIQSTYALQTVEPSWKLAGLSDVDSDGKSDLVWRQPSTGTTAVWKMDGANLVSGVFLPQVVAGDWNLVGTRIVGGDSLGPACSNLDGVGSCETRNCTGGFLRGWATSNFVGSCYCACDDSGRRAATDPGKIALAKPNPGTPCTRQATIAGNSNLAAACEWVAEKSPGPLCKKDDVAALGCKRRAQRAKVPTALASVGANWSRGGGSTWNVKQVGTCTPDGTCDATLVPSPPPATKFAGGIYCSFHVVRTCIFSSGTVTVDSNDFGAWAASEERACEAAFVKGKSELPEREGAACGYLGSHKN